MNLSASKKNSFPKEVWELSDKKISTAYLRACFCFVFFHVILDWPHKMICFLTGHLHDGDILLTSRIFSLFLSYLNLIIPMRFK